MGMSENEIAFIHDAQTDIQRQDLFQAMREGEKAVLIGSTFKMGHGMNVQKRLAAIHHLDVPWRPSDMVQREGRILRQGNENETVRIFRYVTRASFDAYSWKTSRDLSARSCRARRPCVTVRISTIRS